MITNEWSSWLLNKFSLSAPYEMYGEYAYWCQVVKGFTIPSGSYSKSIPLLVSTDGVSPGRTVGSGLTPEEMRNWIILFSSDNYYMTCLALLAQSSRKLKFSEPGLTWASLKNDHLAPHWYGFLAKRRTLFTLNSRKTGSRKQGVFLWTESFSNQLTKIKEDFYDLEPNSFPSSLPTQSIQISISY